MYIYIIMPKPNFYIKKHIKDNEKIFLTLSFNPSNYTTDVVMATVGGTTQSAYRYVIPILFHDFPCTTYDFLYNMYQKGNITGINSTTDRYILSSYNNYKDKMLGQIEWIGNYLTSYTNSNGISNNVIIQEFIVTGATGIYKNVSKVIMDFTLATYDVYFIVKCE